MCDDCTGISPAIDLLPHAGGEGHARARREAVAMALCLRQGRCPRSLVANSLDEEPGDGLLGGSIVAHHAWREYLRDADAMIGAGAHSPRSSLRAGSIMGMTLRRSGPVRLADGR